MTTRSLQFIVVLALLIAGNALAGTAFVIRDLEEPYEETSLRVTVFRNGEGRVLVSKCDTCPTRTLRIVPGTRFLVNGEDQPLERAREFRGKPATVFAVATTDIVSRISVAD